MATKSKARKINISENICQGDVYKDVQYYYIDSQDEETVQVIEFKFPMAVIISQACDVTAMGKMIEDGQGKSCKFMPSVLMCPIYDIDVAKRTTHLDKAFSELSIKKIDGKDDHLFFSDDNKVSQNDLHYRFHNLTVTIDKDIVLDKAIIDFKHYFTVPATYLMKKKGNRLFHIDDLYAEQITLKFSTYLSRVAIP